MKVLVGANPMGLEKAIPALREQFPQVEFDYCPDRGDQLTAMIPDADIYMGWLGAEAFAAAKQLKWIQSPSSGVNMFLDIPALREGDVLLTSASGTHAAAVAESAIGMILAITRGLWRAILDRPQKLWRPQPIRAKMVELTGSTLGIIGCGAIGRALAQRAKGFDMRVVAVDLYPSPGTPNVDEFWGLDRLDDLLAISDYVVVLVPFTPQTVNMIDAAQLAKMKPSAILVGISRGGIINQDALVDALRSGQLAYAALDVFMPEPLPAESPLWEVENLLMAPHIAGGTQLEGKYIIEIFTENLKRFLAGTLPLRNQVNKQAGF